MGYSTFGPGPKEKYHYGLLHFYVVPSVEKCNVGHFGRGENIVTAPSFGRFLGIPVSNYFCTICSQIEQIEPSNWTALLRHGDESLKQQLEASWRGSRGEKDKL